MKAIVLVFLCTISLGACVRSMSQQALFSESLVSKLRATNLGRAVLLLSEVHSKQSNQNYNKLFDALDELATSLQDRINKEDSDFQGAAQQNQADSDFYEKQVEQYTTEVAQYQIDVRNLLQSRTSSEEQLNNKRDELSVTKRQRATVENNLVMNERSFKQKYSDFNEALTVLDQALALLSQAKQSSFIETNSHEYSIAADSMRNTLSQHRVLYQPLVETFTQIAQQKFADQETLRKAIKLLQELRASLDQSRISLQSAYEAERAENQKLVATYNEKAEQLANVIVPGLQGDIETKNGEISTKQSLLREAEANLGEASGNLEATKQAEQQRTVTHKQLIQEYNHDLAILSECVEALNAGGIRRS